MKNLFSNILILVFFSFEPNFLVGCSPELITVVYVIFAYKQQFLFHVVKLTNLKGGCRTRETPTDEHI